MRPAGGPRALPALAAALLVLLAVPAAARAEGRTVAGAVARVDAAARTLSVKDGLGTVWNFVVDRDAGVDLRRFRPGMRVSVTIRRATPLNMSSVADRVRRGDRVEALPPGRPRPNGLSPR